MKLAEQMPLKEIIANNIIFLMNFYQKTRRDVCADLDIKYTTLADWVNAKTYPRLEALINLGKYFGVEVCDFMTDIECNEDLINKLHEHAKNGSVGAASGMRQVGNLIFADYYDTPEGYPVELLNGKFSVCEMPSVKHQSIVNELSYAINSYLKNKKAPGRCFAGPIDIRFSEDLKSVPVPDITIVRDAAILGENSCNGAPDWIIEVMSPGTKGKDITIKKNIYEKNGVKELWIVNPANCNTRVYIQKTDENNNICNEYEDIKLYEFDEVITSVIYNDLSIKLSDLDILD